MEQDRAGAARVQAEGSQDRAEVRAGWAEAVPALVPEAYVCVRSAAHRSRISRAYPAIRLSARNAARRWRGGSAKFLSSKVAGGRTFRTCAVGLSYAAVHFTQNGEVFNDP